MFGIGGLTGLPLGLNVADIPLHDTYYVIAHFHYVVAPGTIFALFAGIYYWFPKATGRKMNETLGKIHFVGSFICMNVVFMPMFLVGLAGVSRRLYDGGASYDFAQPVLHLNVVSSWGAWIMALFQIPFIFNFFWSIWKGEKADDEPVAGDDHRVGGSLAAAARQFPRGAGSAPWPLRVQRSRRGQGLRAAERGLIDMDIPYTVEVRRDTGLNNGKIGIWLFLASEVMLFGALFASLHPDPDGGAELAAGRHDPERPARHVQHDRPDLVLGHDGDGLGVADAPPLRDVPDLHGGDDPARVRLPRGQVLRVQPTSSTTGSFPAPTTSSPSTSR